MHKIKILLVVMALAFSFELLAATPDPCTDADAFRLANQAKAQVTRLLPVLNSTLGVHAIGVGSCDPLDPLTVLDLPSAGLSKNVCGLRLFFSDVASQRAFSATAMLTGNRVSVRDNSGQTTGEVNVCTVVEDPAGASKQ